MPQAINPVTPFRLAISHCSSHPLHLNATGSSQALISDLSNPGPNNPETPVLTETVNVFSEKVKNQNMLILLKKGFS